MKFRTSIFLLISIITSCAKPSISFQTAINKVEDSAGERVIYTLRNRDSVDIWRSAVGLNPLDEYAKQMDAKW